MTFDINDANAVVQVATDLCKGTVKTYSADEADSLIHKALVAANNGKTYLDVRDVRDGKCSALFNIIEQIIKKNVVEGLTGDEYFNKLVETKVVPDGTKPEFRVDDANWYTVSKVSGGNQALRRQRIVGTSRQTIPVMWNVIKIYDEMERILSNQTNIADSIRDVSKSFKQQILADVAYVWENLTSAQLGGSTYNVTGVFSENDMMQLIGHVEAKAGANATIYGSKVAVSKLESGVVADSAKEDYYNLGYYGKFRGTSIAVVPQRHQIGTDNFLFNDNVINVLAGPSKPIKLVIEGNPLVNLGKFFDNQDLSQEYVYGQKYGVGFILSSGAIGRYTISSGN